MQVAHSVESDAYPFEINRIGDGIPTGLAENPHGPRHMGCRGNQKPAFAGLRVHFFAGKDGIFMSITRFGLEGDPLFEIIGDVGEAELLLSLPADPPTATIGPWPLRQTTEMPGPCFGMTRSEAVAHRARCRPT